MDLATLVVKLEAQSAQYVAELNKANNQLAKFHADAKAHMDGIAGTLGELKKGATELIEAFAVKEIGEFFNKIIEGAAEMNGLSKETGIAVGTLSALSAAAETKGVDDLGLAMNRLARAARESLDPTSDAAAAFKSIKVSATDAEGRIKPLDQLFLEVADSFAKYQDGANKSAISTSLLGKAGFRLIDFMDEGKKGINEIIESMGGYARLSQKGANDSQAFEENLLKLSLTYKALTREGIEPILPDLIELEQDFLKLEVAVGKFNIVSGPLIVGARAIRAAFAGVSDVLKIIPETFDAITEFEKKGGADLFKNIAAAEDAVTQLEKHPTDAINIFKNAWAKMAHGVATGASDIGNAIHGVDDTLTEFKPDLPSRLGKHGNELPAGSKKPEINLITGPQLREQADALKQLTKFKETIEDQVASFGLGSVAVAKYSLEFGKLHDILVKAGPKGKVVAQEILAAEAAMEKLKNADSLVQIGAHMDELKNNTEAASAALFDLQNRALTHNLGETNDQAGLAKLDHLRELTIAQAKYNDLQTQAGIIQDNLKIKEDAIQRAVDSGSEDELQAQGDLKDARQQAVVDLGNIYTKMKAISDANAQDMPKMVQDTNKFKSSLDDLEVKTEDVANKMRTDVIDSASDAWASWVDGEKSASDAFKDFIKNIEREISQLIAKNMFEDLFKPLDSGSKSGGGGFFSSLAAMFTGASAGPDTAAASAASSAAADSVISQTSPALLDLAGGLARGGMVKGQKMYVVGEHGPEVIVPTHGGVVIPNHRAHSLVSGLATRSFAARSGPTSIADHHSDSIRIASPRVTTPKTDVGVHIHISHDSTAMHAPVFAHRALGGPVTQGRGTMVGEFGPELYAPQVNNAQLESNRTDKSVHVTNHFALPPGGNVSRATQSQIASSVARSVQVASVRNQ